MKLIQIFLLILIIIGIGLICTQNIWVPRLVNDIVPSDEQNVTDIYFGDQSVGDLNGDGLPDKAFIVTEDGGGSGTFFYIEVSLHAKNGYENTNPIFLGDRIAPQGTEIKNGKITVNYADRKATDPMTAQPSVGVTRYFIVSGNKLKEISDSVL